VLLPPLQLSLFPQLLSKKLRPQCGIHQVPSCNHCFLGSILCCLLCPLTIEHLHQLSPLHPAGQSLL
jgi:hypothetical protein